MESKQYRHEIAFSRAKLAGFSLGSLAFVALGLLLWHIADDIPRESPIFVRFISVTCIAFFGLIAISSLPKLLDPRPGLIISDTGIKDNSSGVSGGFIAWQDIQSVEVSVVRGSQFLLIHIKDAKTYLRRANPFKRLIMQINQRLYGTPLSISAKALACDFQSLAQLIETGLAARSG